MRKKNYKNIALIVAGGNGSRYGGDIPKQYLSINNQSILSLVVNKFLNHNSIDAVMVGINENHLELYNKAIESLDLLPYSLSGTRRQDTVRNLLEAVAEYSPDNVLIHDSARIFIDNETIEDLIQSLEHYKGAIAATRVNDTIKKTDGRKVLKTISRDNMFLAQTPQAFDYKTILSLHRQYQGEDFTDDSALCERDGIEVKVIDSPIMNFKITREIDFEFAKKIMSSENGK